MEKGVDAEKAASRGEGPERPLLAERSFRAFDTCNIVRADCGDDVLEGAEAFCLRLHDRLNRFDPVSEVSRLGRGDGSPVACSSHVRSLLQVAIALHAESSGAFNPAVAPLMDLWGFGGGGSRFPDSCELERALLQCDLAAADVLEDGRVRLPAGMRLDFGSIAKGYAAECVQAMLRQAGARCGFADFGGTVAVLGPKPDGGSWTLGLPEVGAPYGGGFWALLDAREGAFATSAGYFRSVERWGGRVNHVVDPRTGRPVDNGVAEVTVHCAGATMADALSTTLYVLGAEEGMALARDLGAGALFRMEDGSVRATPGFPVRILEGER